MNTSFEPKSQAPTQHKSKRENQNSKAYPSRTIVHAKLEMTEPGDHDEREADAMADAVISGGKIARKISSGGGSSSGIAVSQQMESQLSQLQGGGRQMPEGLRSMMEGGFGQDFGQVRLHTDSEAAKMSSSIHAKAFTHGNDIYFNRGQFSPETSEGQRLVAHELTHVVQGTGKVGREPNANEGDLYDPSKFDDRLFLGKNPFFMNFDFGPNDSRLSFRRFNQDMNNRLIQNNRLVFSYLNNRELNYIKTHLPKDIALDYNYNNFYDPDELVLDYVPGKGGVVGSRKDVDRMKIRATGDMIRETADNIRGGPHSGFYTAMAILFGVTDPEKLYLASQYGAGLDLALTGMYGGPRGTRFMRNAPQYQYSQIESPYKGKTAPLSPEFMKSQQQARPNLEGEIQKLKAQNDVIKEAYKEVSKSKLNEQLSEKAVNDLLLRYEKILEDMPKYSEDAVKSDVFQNANKQVTLLKWQLEYLRNLKVIESLESLKNQ